VELTCGCPYGFAPSVMYQTLLTLNTRIKRKRREGIKTEGDRDRERAEIQRDQMY